MKTITPAGGPPGPGVRENMKVMKVNMKRIINMNNPP
jgi:hypothetical protein